MFYLPRTRTFFNEMFIRIYRLKAERIIRKPDNPKFNRLLFKKR